MRPSREELLMKHAEIASLRGTCNRAQVGAVVSRNGRILVTGYNGAPAGLPHCNHSAHDDKPCMVAVHAEENCIAYAARYGISLIHGEMDTTCSPCLFCARLIINAGIQLVRYKAEYRVTDGLELLTEAKVSHWRVS